MNFNEETQNDILKIKTAKDLNEKYGYKRIELFGKFDHRKTLLKNSIKEGIIGYDVFTPFLYQDTDTLNEKTIFVDRGFIQKETYNLNPDLILNNSTGYITLRGFITLPHLTKNSGENDYITKDEIKSVKLDEFCDFSNVKGILARHVYLKSIEFNEDDQSVFPLGENLSTLNKFNIPICANECYKKVFSFISFAAVFGNMAMWIAF